MNELKMMEGIKTGGRKKKQRSNKIQEKKNKWKSKMSKMKGRKDR